MGVEQGSFLCIFVLIPPVLTRSLSVIEVALPDAINVAGFP